MDCLGNGFGPGDISSLGCRVGTPTKTRPGGPIFCGLNPGWNFTEKFGGHCWWENKFLEWRLAWGQISGVFFPIIHSSSHVTLCCLCHYAYIYIYCIYIILIYTLVGGFNPSENISQNRNLPQIYKDENKEYLKPPPSDTCCGKRRWRTPENVCPRLQSKYGKKSLGDCGGSWIIEVTGEEIVHITPHRIHVWYSIFTYMKTIKINQM